MQRKRIHYVRYKKLPEGAKKVTRGTRWGNDYKTIENGGSYTRAEAVALFRQDVESMTPEYRAKWLAPLRGATMLACCHPSLSPCHADVLIEFLAATE